MPEPTTPVLTTEELFAKLYAGSITAKEKEALWENLKREHKYGTLPSRYPCPNCKKPLSFTWNWGVACASIRSIGCGWKPPGERYNALKFES